MLNANGGIKAGSVFFFCYFCPQLAQLSFRVKVQCLLKNWPIKDHNFKTKNEIKNRWSMATSLDNVPFLLVCFKSYVAGFQKTYAFGTVKF